MNIYAPANNALMSGLCVFCVCLFVCVPLHTFLFLENKCIPPTEGGDLAIVSPLANSQPLFCDSPMVLQTGDVTFVQKVLCIVTVRLFRLSGGRIVMRKE